MPWRCSSRITRASVDSRLRFGFSALLVFVAFSATGFVVSALRRFGRGTDGGGPRDIRRRFGWPSASPRAFVRPPSVRRAWRLGRGRRIVRCQRQASRPTGLGGGGSQQHRRDQNEFAHVKSPVVEALRETRSGRKCGSVRWVTQERAAAVLGKISNFSRVGNTGAANRTRTCDPVITNDVLYQLSYCGGPSDALGQRPENAGT